MSIKDWPEADRPREKLLARGAAALTDAELLAIFLRTGLAGCSAVDLARDLLQRFGGLRALMAADLQTFSAAKGLGSAKYAQLQAVLEMARRHLHEDLRERRDLSDPRVVGRYLKSQLRDRDREVFSALFLDAHNRLIAFEELAVGSLESTSVYAREVVKAALRLQAAAVIFAHNHPSGVCEPSMSDHHLTRKLKEALKLVEVRVLDHFVVGEGSPVSFAERGWL